MYQFKAKFHFGINDDDDKLVIVPEGREYSDEQIDALVEFQEQFFEHVILRKEKDKVR